MSSRHQSTVHCTACEFSAIWLAESSWISVFSGLKTITYFVDCHFFVIFVDCSLYYMRVFCNLIGREQLFFSFQWFQKWLHKLYFCRDINEIYSITHDISIVTNFTRHFPLHLDILLIAFIPWNTTMNQAIQLLIKNWMGCCEKKEIALTTLKSPLIELLMLISRGSSLKSSVEFAKIPCIWLYT